MPSILLGRRWILIVIGMITTAILVFALAILFGPESSILWVMVDAFLTVLGVLITIGDEQK